MRCEWRLSQRRLNKYSNILGVVWAYTLAIALCFVPLHSRSKLVGRVCSSYVYMMEKTWFYRCPFVRFRLQRSPNTEAKLAIGAALRNHEKPTTKEKL